ncbi:MAG: hypothetical protein P1U68_14365 [Verrucomicrobiales bacterium]|nr:hypothetical protein [Verrucomicrobiales bacterium]
MTHRIKPWSLFLLALATVLPAVGGEYFHDKSPIEAKGVYEEEDHPDENLWIYTKGTKVREQGSWEFKLKNVSRIGKLEGSYQFHDFRPEIEYGITDKLTFGASVFLFHHDYRNVPWGPMNERNPTPGGINGTLGNYTGTQLGGFEFNTKYNVLDPFEDSFGLSFGLSFDHRVAYRLDGGRINQDALTPQIFIQKSLMDDRLQLAFHGKLEHEQRKGGEILEEEIAPDLALGVSYELKKDIWIGLETRWQTDALSPYDVVAGAYGDDNSPSNWDFNEYAIGDQFQWGLYVGPTIHWDPSDKPWWITAGALVQVSGWSDDGNTASSGGRNWDEHEKIHAGITFGYEWEANKRHGK